MTEYPKGAAVPWFDLPVTFSCDCVAEEKSDRVEIRSTGEHRAAFDAIGSDARPTKTLVLMPAVASVPAQVWRP